jgi:hypothetical protein
VTKYEILSTLVSCIAAFISLVVWGGQRKLQREANDLQRVTAKLAEKQLEMIHREEKGKNTARLTLSLIKDGKSYRFRISNIGEVDALNVDFELLPDDPDKSPLIKSEIKEKLPAKRLSPGTSVSLIAALHMSSPTAYSAKLRWSNPDGSTSEEETYAAL